MCQTCTILEQLLKSLVLDRFRPGNIYKTLKIVEYKVDAAFEQSVFCSNIVRITIIQFIQFVYTPTIIILVSPFSFLKHQEKFHLYLSLFMVTYLCDSSKQTDFSIQQ